MRAALGGINEAFQFAYLSTWSILYQSLTPPYKIYAVTIDQIDIRRNLAPRLIAFSPFTSSTKPVGSLPSSFHCCSTLRPACNPTW